MNLQRLFNRPRSGILTWTQISPNWKTGTFKWNQSLCVINLVDPENCWTKSNCGKSLSSLTCLPQRSHLCHQRNDWLPWMPAAQFHYSKSKFKTCKKKMTISNLVYEAWKPLLPLPSRPRLSTSKKWKGWRVSKARLPRQLKFNNRVR